MADPYDEELIEVEDTEAPEVVETEDGGAVVTIEDEEPARSEDFLKNLAEEMSASDLNSIGSQFLDAIEKDKEARKRRDEQYTEGLRRTGLGDDAPGGAEFEGASKVVHPMLTEACVDFSARAMKELFPVGGPVKDSVPGDPTEEKIAKAKRKTTLLNYQLTVMCPEFRAELEQLMTQLPLGGAQYLKVNWNEERNKPTFLFVAIDEMYLPYAASNFYTAQRKTHVQYLTQIDYEQRVKSGMYRDVDLAPPGSEPEQSAAGKANDKIEGRSQDAYNQDGLRTVFEVHALTRLEGDERTDGELAPYIITIDQNTRCVLAIYRNWDEPDETREELQWFVEFPFVPWRGAYPIGLPHMIGGLSGATTGALRALLDSAHLQNVASGLHLKTGVNGQSINPTPGTTSEVEAPIGVTDIRQIFMPLPFNGPSATLFSLLGFLVDAGRDVIRTTFDDLADNNANAPVGTTLALIEQGMQVYSAIHQRLHAAMDGLLRILHRLNATHLDDEKLEHEAGEELASRKDFQGPLDVVPVSDPNIFSEVQRVAQVQTIAQRANERPQLYDQRKVEERLLQTLKIPDYEDLLVAPVEPKEQNAVNENVAATLGRPVMAFPDQDHLAHLKTHLEYMISPAFGMSPLIAPRFLPVMLGHLTEHIALWYAATVFDNSNIAVGTDIGDVMRGIKDPDERKALDRMLAEAGANAIVTGDDMFGPKMIEGPEGKPVPAGFPAVIQQAQAVMQQFAPQPMQDPRIAIEGQKLQQKAAADQQDAALKGQQLQVDAKESAEDRANRLQIEQLRQDREDERTRLETEARLLANTEDNQTAKQLAAAEIISGDKVAIENGGGINPNP